MSAFLLDVNVLIALIDPAHVHHDTAHAWFKANGRQSWASCPLTENGVVRIVSHPKYPNCIGSPGLAADVMARFCALRGHVFWADDISLLDGKLINPSRLLGSSQITDSDHWRLRAPKMGDWPPSTIGLLSMPCEAGALHCI